ncbi:hypothetical protein [Phenylobacterium sp.]|uniref:hypothetical protein n=1 Tax=Phenylobacterium sp. TaxID=1871053 RepID=UPI002E2EB021|nr:hypothetical protein [Phenylobacterium sp.]HEX2562232.1 hypothetical protein [Phenylobacterium sp.]
MAPASEAGMVRVQAFLSEAEVEALDREARFRRQSRSQAARQAIARGLSGRIPADPDDRLLNLERRLHTHMRLTVRDLRIIEELVFALTRLILTRLPETADDRDPLLQAAVEVRLQRLLDEVAAKISSGPARPPPEVEPLPPEAPAPESPAP